jgi:hypothetical protein
VSKQGTAFEHLNPLVEPLPILDSIEIVQPWLFLMVGAEGDNRLHGFKGDTGEPLLPAASPTMVGLLPFQTLIANRDRLYVGGDGRI